MMPASANKPGRSEIAAFNLGIDLPGHLNIWDDLSKDLRIRVAAAAHLEGKNIEDYVKDALLAYSDGTLEWYESHIKLADLSLEE